MKEEITVCEWCEEAEPVIRVSAADLDGVVYCSNYLCKDCGANPNLEDAVRWVLRGKTTGDGGRGR